MFPCLKIDELNRGDVLVDDFKGHSIDPVKDYVKSFKSGDWLDNEEDQHGLVDFHTMAGGMTTKDQPLDFFTIKVMKGHCRDFYGIHMLTSPLNPIIGNHMTPRRQLCATWVAEAWDNVPGSLITKARKVGNYKKYEEIKKQVRMCCKHALLTEMNMKLLNTC